MLFHLPFVIFVYMSLTCALVSFVIYVFHSTNSLAVGLFSNSFVILYNYITRHIITMLKLRRLLSFIYA